MMLFSQQMAENTIPRDYPHREELLAATRALFPKVAEGPGALSVDVVFVQNRLTIEVVWPVKRPA